MIGAGESDPHPRAVALGILARHELGRAEGKPLYWYRCSDTEFERLRGRLRVFARDLLRDIPDDATCAAFCMYGAEWWRRHHAGGPWKWEGILAGAGLDDAPWPWRREVVRAGLRWWGRGVLKRGTDNVYLVTLACEGGLPLNLVRKEGAALQRYFRALLEDARTYEPSLERMVHLAETQAHRLPKSLRQEPVYLLSASLIDAIVGLQRDLAGTAPTISELDRVRPNWRADLPLRVDDATAEGFLTGLIADADAVRLLGATPKIARRLALRDGGADVVAECLLPASVPVEAMSALFEAGADSAPGRIQLLLQLANGERRRIGLATKTHAGRAYRIEPVQHQHLVLIGEAAMGELRVITDAGPTPLRSPVLPGGGPLGEQPWVFADAHSDSGALLAEGSCRTQREVALVAIDPAWHVDPIGGAALDRIGDRTVAGRDVYRVRGEVTIEGDGERWRIRTGATAEDHVEHFVGGDARELGGTLVYFGPPRLLARSQSGAVHRVADHQITWRPMGQAARWRSHLDSCVGGVEIKRIVDGETRARHRAYVVPREARVEVRSGSGGGGELVFRGFQGVTIDLEPSHGVEVVTGPEPALRCAANADPNESLRLRLHWPDRAPLPLRLPLPLRRGWFLCGDSLLPSGACVAKEQLLRMRAMVASPHANEHFYVRGVLRDPRGSSKSSLTGLNRKMWVELELVATAAGQHTVELHRLIEPIDRALQMVGLDVEVRLELEAHGARLPKCVLHVRHYERRLDLDKSGGTVRVEEQPADEALATDVHGVAAMRLWEPQTDLEELPLVVPGVWAFTPERRLVGPWLVYGYDVTGRACTRPCAWPVAAAEGAMPAGEATANLAVACSLPDRDQRRDAFLLRLERLPEQPTHQDWDDLLATVEWTKRLPAAAFEYVAALPHRPLTLIYLLLRASADQREQVWALQDQLPFRWELLPIAAWSEATRLYAAMLRSRCEAAGLPVEEGDAALATKLKALAVWAEGRPFAVLASYLRWTVLPVAGELDASLIAASSPQGRDTLFRRIDNERQQVLRRHPHEWWPQGSDITEAAEHYLAALPETHHLWRPLRQYHASRMAVLAAPAVAAATAVVEEERADLEPVLCYQIAMLRSFDEQWFDGSYELSLAILLGLRAAHAEACP